MNTMYKLVLAALLAAQLAACVPAVVGGAAAGGAVAADRRTSGNYVDDESIELKAVKKMETNLGEQSHVNVTSYNRNVLLTGEVPTDEHKAKAESLLREIENVRTVTNEIVVAPKTSIGSRTSDTYITSKIKSKFVTENQFAANHVKIVTENSTVYLLGLVTKTEGDAAAAIASSTDGVDKVVKVFEYVEPINAPPAKPVAAPAK
jgi:osmotically-inducible protein OsmY